jgi:hypothetical protein
LLLLLNIKQMLIVIRSGIQITSNIYYNSIDFPSSASIIPETADSVPAIIKTFWYCQNCRKTFSFRKAEVTQHITEECGRNTNDDTKLKI